MTDDDLRARFHVITSGPELAELRNLDPPIPVQGRLRRGNRFLRGFLRRNWFLLLLGVIIALIVTASAFI